MRVLSILAAAGLATARMLGASNKQDSGHSKLKVPGDNPLEFCQDPIDHILTITNVDLDPNPIKRGEDLLITATGILDSRVEEGAYVMLQVKYGLITLIKANESLCEQMEKVDKSCPLEKGDLEFQKTVQLPAEIPPGKFHVQADVFTKEDKRITCLIADVVFPAY